MDYKVEEAKRLLYSDDSETRQLGWHRLFGSMRQRLYYLFLEKTLFHEDSEDLLQDLYVNIHLRLEIGKLPTDVEPEAYVYRSTHNLVNTWFRRKKIIDAYSDLCTRETTIQRFLRASSEESELETKKTEEALSLMLNIPNELDRLIAILWISLNLKPKHIHLLTGWDISYIRAAIKRVNRNISINKKDSRKILNTEDKWSKELKFTGDNYPICVAYVNINISGLEPKSLENLLKDLDVKTYEELQDRYVGLLRVEGVNIAAPSLHLTFMPRRFFSESVFYHGEYIRYKDYTVTFHRVTENGSWKDVIELTYITEFTGRIAGKILDESTEWVGITYEFPTINMLAKKAFNEKLLYYVSVPWSREATIYIYRAYPIDENKPFPGPTPEDLIYT